VFLPLHERIGTSDSFVRVTTGDADAATQSAPLIPDRFPRAGEQYRFHFDMTKCIGCRSCEVACNEQNGNPATIHWRRIGEIEGGEWPHTRRHYLSMGCNHCLDPDCLRGCPVNAYTKDPLTGIVLHSAEACIGCQYCVWNCPYSVPQFNPERGVVGKCDMCYGRLAEGFEPACVNACPERAIEVEIVNIAEWRADYSAAESPGMPAAGQTLSTTRITLPKNTSVVLERVDTDRIRPEHAHLSLVLMTVLMQMVIGSLFGALLFHAAGKGVLTILLFATSIALNISVFHLGRPAYAWRALKMWRRSWLSREVLLFGLFSGALALATATSWVRIFPQGAPVVLGWLALIAGLAGIMASAFIYLVPARPAWNMVHTPTDFLLSAALLGFACTPLMIETGPPWNARLLWLSGFSWTANLGIKLLRLYHANLFEKRASAALLCTPRLRALLLMSFALVGLAMLCAGNHAALASVFAVCGVLLSRYLFFVSVVPLNMALTFVRGGHE
jgi:formate dehydrogenase iron-sulfur subunit